jgi:pyruvate dehydrogenase E2 component (dihydrolipoamide acetyltransferase)
VSDNRTLDPRGEAEIVTLSRIERVAARQVSDAKATIPEIVLQRDVDMTAAVQLRETLQAEGGKAADGGVTPSFNDIVVRACALALREHPRANSSWTGDAIAVHSRVNVGVAVAHGLELFVPTVFDADRCSLGEIARETRRLAEAARSRRLSFDELSGGTFTVSNLGMLGIERFTAIINPPQAAILAVGAIREAVRGGRQPMCLSLTCDHRILSGALGAQLLASIADKLREPACLVDAHEPFEDAAGKGRG